jgi:hypothetical protein
LGSPSIFNITIVYLIFGTPGAAMAVVTNPAERSAIESNCFNIVFSLKKNIYWGNPNNSVN